MIRNTGMLENIIAHSEQVHRVALYLTQGLCDAGICLNGELIGAAALLHDITKTRSLNSGENHAASGKALLTGLGYPEVGAIVGQHVHLTHFSSQSPPNEAEIVNYADKRVLHDQVVPLEQRFDYILGRYAKGDRLRKAYLSLVSESRALEAKIFRHLTFSVDDLPRLVNHRPPEVIPGG